MMLRNSIKVFAVAMCAIFTISTAWSMDHENEHESDHVAHQDEHVEEHGDEHHEEEGVNVTEMIMHHIKDAHEWHIMGPEHGEGAVIVHLPVILVDGGVKFFMSSDFHYDAEKHYSLTEDGAYAMFHGKVYKTVNGELQMDEHHHPTNAKPLDFSITKNVLALIVGAILLILLLGSAAKSYKNNGMSAPKGIAKFVEPIVIFVRDDIAKSNIGEKKYKKFMPYLLTAFFFIWILNMLGLIPFIPGGANVTGNISFTLVMALFTLLLTLFNGNKHYWRHIFATPGVPVWLLPIMIPVEIVGVFAKPFALMVRLFANITAGHIIILSLVGIIFTFQSEGWAGLSVPMALFISVLELLVAFLQAFIFTMLSALFIGAAVDDHH